MQDGASAKAITQACFDGGMLLCPCGTGGQVMKLIPPLTISDEDLERGLDIFEASVNQVMVAA